MQHEIPSTKRTRIPLAIALGDPWCFLGLGFGSGLAPKAPGTFGTLAAVPIYWALWQAGPTLYLAITMALFLLGIKVCAITEKRIGIQDHSGIVWDEIVGFLATMFLVPPTWVSIFTGFIAFRLFDIAKPWPIRWFDRKVHGGLGVMLDDVLAGIMASVVTHFSLHWFTTLTSNAP